MKEFDKSESADGLSFDVRRKEKEREEEIEEEIKEIEKATEGDARERDEEVWDGSESLFVEDDDASEYEDKYSGIKFSFSLKERELISCLRHCGWNINLFIFGTILFLILDVFSLAVFILDKNIFTFLYFLAAILISILWGLNISPSFFDRVAYQRNLIGQKLNIEIYPDSIVIKKDKKEQTVPLDGTCRFEDFNNMFLIFLENNKVFVIPKRVIEPDLLPDVEAMLIAGTTPLEKN